ITVVIEERHAGPELLGVVMPSAAALDVVEGDARRARDVGKPYLRSGRAGGLLSRHQPQRQHRRDRPKVRGRQVMTVAACGHVRSFFCKIESSTGTVARRKRE